MDKRSALFTAGGLAASFVAGAAAVSFNWGIAASDANTTATGGVSFPLKPVVKHRTVVIHKKAPTATGAAARPVVVLTPAAPAQTQTSAVVTTSGSHGAGNSENESGGDD
jgi:hypothetical protein